MIGVTNDTINKFVGTTGVDYVNDMNSQVKAWELISLNESTVLWKVFFRVLIKSVQYFSESNKNIIHSCAFATGRIINESGGDFSPTKKKTVKKKVDMDLGSFL